WEEAARDYPRSSLHLTRHASTKLSIAVLHVPPSCGKRKDSAHRQQQRAAGLRSIHRQERRRRRRVAPPRVLQCVARLGIPSVEKPILDPGRKSRVKPKAITGVEAV